MKNKIIILTLIFLFASSIVMGLTLINLTPDEAYESAAENNIQFEVDELNLELMQIAYEKTLKSASILALNNYSGQLVKYYNPYISETNLIAKEMENTRSRKQLEIDIISTSISLESALLAYDEADTSYSQAVTSYNEALADPTVSSSDELSLKYAMESLKISLHQAQNNMESAQHRLDDIVGQDGVSVLLPVEYSSPYVIEQDKVYESALETNIGIFKSKRSAMAAEIKFDIAEKYYDNDEEIYISALAGFKNAELAYDKSLVSLEMNVLDDINNLKNKFDSIALAELYKKIKLDEYNAAKSQFNAGILSENQFDSAEDTYITSQKQLESKIHDYILASMRFTMDYGYDF